MAKKESLVSKVKGYFSRPGAFEKPNQEKRVIPVGFARPENLEAQMLRVVRSELFRESVRRRAGAMEEQLPPEGPQSPHELVYDEDLGRELTRWEKEAIDRDRVEFDRQVSLRKAHVERIRKNAPRKKAAMPPKKDEKSDGADAE